MVFEDLSDEQLEKFDSYDHHEVVRKVMLGIGSSAVTAFIAVHNTHLGPALGGLRMRPYATEDEAINDVLRLSRGMTYKNAMAGLPLGGGKAVIIGNPFTQKNPAIMEDMGRAVEALDGRYVTAEDSGTGESDMVAIARHTDNVTGLPPEPFEDSQYGELGGNPSPVTALGCYHGLKVAAKHVYGDDNLSGKTVAVQGLGAVGLALCELLHQDGVRLIGADVNEKSVELAKADIPEIEIVASDEIYGVNCDIFAPCAMGGVLNDDTIPRLKCKIVAGAANNQLLAVYHDQQLVSRGITYVPDYVINAGGVICVGYEFFRKSGYNPMDFTFSREAMLGHVARIGQTVADILKYSSDNMVNPGEAADKIAEARFLGAEALPDDESNPEDGASFGSYRGKTLVQ